MEQKLDRNGELPYDQSKSSRELRSAVSLIKKYSKIVQAFLAHGFGQAVNVLSQVVTVPFFLSIWGSGKYGEWLLLSTIPSYLALSDLGISSVAANDMDIRAGRGEIDYVNTIYQTATLAVGCLVSFIFLSGLAAWFFLPNANTHFFKFISNHDVRWVIVLMGADVACAVLFGTQAAALRCSGKYPLSVFLTNLVRLAAIVVSVVVLILTHSPVMVTLGMLITRVTGLCAFSYLVHRYSTSIRLFPLRPDFAWLKKALIPSFAFLGFPLGHSLNIQGMLWAVGISLGPSAVVAMSTMRTLTRVVLQVLNLLANAIWSEVSSSFGRGEFAKVRMLRTKLSIVTIGSAVFFGIILFFIGKPFYSWWTHKPALFITPVFAILLISMVANSMWQSTTIFLIATNRHSRFSVIYLVAVGIAISVGFFTGRRFGLIGVASIILIMDICLASIAEYQVNKTL